MKKILALMLMLGSVAITTAAVNAWKIKGIDARYAKLVNSKVPAITHLVRANRQATEVLKNGFRSLTYAPESPAAAAAAAGMDRSFALANASLTDAVKLDPELAQTVQDRRAQLADILRLTREAVDRRRAGDQAGAIRILARADRVVDDFSAALKNGNDKRIAANSAESSELGKSTKANLILALAVSILATLGAVIIAHRVVRGSIVGPLLELNNQMAGLAAGDHRMSIAHSDRRDEIGTMSRSVMVFRDQAEERERLEAEKQRSIAEQQKVVAAVGKHLDLLAAGDLTSAIREEFPPNYRQLRESFNSALHSLSALIRTVADSAAEIRTGSREIAQASEDLARRTEGNAANLEQTGAAIVEMDGRLKASADAASATVERADQAIATVSGGRVRADEAVQAMGRVSDSAKGIDDVIEGLDKIAFQTRVLAMNAAVEAGRAGEAGRGFAVVADLVSALAMRAEEEAKRARDQLTVTQTDIVMAVGAVEKVDAALQNISADVGEVHQLLGSMASDNQAQSLAITEINTAIANMDKSTQQNAAMVEETSAAARNLLTEVNGLSEQAGKFRTDERTAPTAKVSPPPKRSAAPPIAPPIAPPPAREAVNPRPKPAKTKFPKRGKEGTYQSPVKPIPAAAIAALTRPEDDDWKEF